MLDLDPYFVSGVNILSSTVPSPRSSGTLGTFAVDTVVMTFPAWKTFFASWQAKEPVPPTDVVLLVGICK